MVEICITLYHLESVHLLITILQSVEHRQKSFLCIFFFFYKQFFLSGISGRRYNIGPVCLYVCLSALGQVWRSRSPGQKMEFSMFQKHWLVQIHFVISCDVTVWRHDDIWCLWARIQWGKILTRRAGRGRAVNAQAFSYDLFFLDLLFLDTVFESVVESATRCDHCM